MTSDGPVYDGLHRLSSHSGARTEVLAAAYRAQVLYIRAAAESEQTTTSNARLDTVQDLDGKGGVKLLPIGESDASVTAKMLIAAPELIIKGQAVAYCKALLADAASTPNDRVMAYTGLAAVKSPELLDITRMLKENADLTTAQKLYLGELPGAAGRLHQRGGDLQRAQGGGRGVHRKRP
jgi:hypothetical protein